MLYLFLCTCGVGAGNSNKQEFFVSYLMDFGVLSAFVERKNLCMHEFIFLLIEEGNYGVYFFCLLFLVGIKKDGESNGKMLGSDCRLGLLFPFGILERQQINLSVWPAMCDEKQEN